jgi:tetratricopeptide (TPR) repeat protein
MIKRGKAQWVALGLAAVLTGTLLALPRVPLGAAQENRRAAEAATAQEVLSPDPEVAALLGQLTDGAPPMQTILALRSFAQEHPENVEAQWHLGLLSWQTGQYDKALDRFKRTVELDPTGHPDAWAFIGRIYSSLDSTPQAVAALERYKTLVTDTALVRSADELISTITKS